MKTKYRVYEACLGNYKIGNKKVPIAEIVFILNKYIIAGIVLSTALLHPQSDTLSNNRVRFSNIDSQKLLIKDKILGIMWHPEREKIPAQKDCKLIKNLFSS